MSGRSSESPPTVASGACREGLLHVATMIGAPVPATAALAVRAWLGTARMTSGLIAQFPACPATEQCLGGTRIKALGAHGGESVLGRLGSRRHAPDANAAIYPELGSNFGSNLSEPELI
jgi:hypothetical protein